MSNENKLITHLKRVASTPSLLTTNCGDNKLLPYHFKELSQLTTIKTENRLAKLP